MASKPFTVAEGETARLGASATAATETSMVDDTSATSPFAEELGARLGDESLAGRYEVDPARAVPLRFAHGGEGVGRFP